LKDLNKLNLNDILNKVTIYNLLVKNVLSYNYIHNEIYVIDKSNFNLINNIDKIYWINLEESIKRKENMIHLLNNLPDWCANLHNQRKPLAPV
jgi:hypothetical protein